MNTVNATAAQAPKAVTLKTPAWMACATLEELNAYLKKSKTGGVKAEGIRAKWNSAQVGTAGAALNGTPLPPEGDNSDVGFGDKQEEEERTGVLGPALQEPQVPTEEVTEESGTIGDLADAEEERLLKKHQDEQKCGQGTLSGLQRSQDVPLLPTAPKAVPGLITRYIDPRLIDVREGWNARMDFGDLEELATSILSQKKLDGHGLINDIRVKELPNGRYELIDGERRWQSVMGLIDRGHEWDFGIPAKVEPADATDRELIIKMFTANLGKPLLPYEEALYYKRLRDSGMTLREIEDETGRSDNSIVGALALLTADDDLVQAVIKGQVGATMAKAIAVSARGDKAKQKALTAKAKEAKSTGDSKKLSAVKKDIDDARRAKSAKKAPNLKLKARKADESEIASMGTDVGAKLKERMEELGLDFETDLEEWVAGDRELQIAANFGALQALKNIMGVKSKVTF